MNRETSRKVWIANSIFSWAPFVEGSSTPTSESFPRSYRFLEHAENIVTSKSPSELQLCDAINNLKKAVHNRIEDINRLYKISRLDIVGIPDGLFQRLSLVGIIKPHMLGVLNDLRNEIEHRYVKPPGKERCLELAEYVWYFLRSTDKLVSQIIDMYKLELESERYYVDICRKSHSVSSSPWETSDSYSVYCWLREQDVSLFEQAGWIEFDGCKVKTAREFQEEHQPQQDVNTSWSKLKYQWEDRNESDLNLKIEKMSDFLRLKFIQNYFAIP